MTGPKAIPGPRRRRRLLFALSALVVGCGLAACLVELAFRWFWTLPSALADFAQQGLYQERADGTIGLTPGYRGQLTVSGRTTTVAIDALGMRGPDGAERKPGVQRWLMLGDSLVFGYGVEVEDSLPQKLQGALQREGVEAVVGNAGVPGYGVRDAVAAMASHDRAFGADGFVLCSFLGNDALDDLRVDQAVASGLRFDGPMARLVRSSPRFRWALRSRAMLWFETWIFINHPTYSPLLQQAPTAAELQALAGLPGAYPVFTAAQSGLFLDAADLQHAFVPDVAPVLPRLLASLRQELLRAREVAAGRPLVFVVLPPRVMVDEELRQRRLAADGLQPASAFPRGTAQARWIAVAQELGLKALDATPRLAAAPAQPSPYVDEGHLSGAGADIVVEGLVPLLRR